jgi:hypothetical protein
MSFYTITHGPIFTHIALVNPLSYNYNIVSSRINMQYLPWKDQSDHSDCARGNGASRNKRIGVFSVRCCSYTVGGSKTAPETESRLPQGPPLGRTNGAHIEVYWFSKIKFRVLCDWYLSVIRPYQYSLLSENTTKSWSFILDSLYKFWSKIGNASIPEHKRNVAFAYEVKGGRINRTIDTCFAINTTDAECLYTKMHKMRTSQLITLFNALKPEIV